MDDSMVACLAQTRVRTRLGSPQAVEVLRPMGLLKEAWRERSQKKRSILSIRCGALDIGFQAMRSMAGAVAINQA